MTSSFVGNSDGDRVLRGETLKKTGLKILLYTKLLGVNWLLIENADRIELKLPGDIWVYFEHLGKKSYRLHADVCTPIRRGSSPLAFPITKEAKLCTLVSLLITAVS